MRLSDLVPRRTPATAWPPAPTFAEDGSQTVWEQCPAHGDWYAKRITPQGEQSVILACDHCKADADVHAKAERMLTAEAVERRVAQKLRDSEDERQRRVNVLLAPIIQGERDRIEQDELYRDRMSFTAEARAEELAQIMRELRKEN